MKQMVAAPRAAAGGGCVPDTVMRLIDELRGELGTAVELLAAGVQPVHVGAPAGAESTGRSEFPAGPGVLCVHRSALSGEERRLAVLIGRLVGLELDAMDGSALDRRQRLAALESVLAGQRIPMAVQPILDITTGALVGVEALARFRDHRSGAAQHFADATRLGRGVELELMAVRSALPTMAVLPEGTYLSVNCSPAALSSPTFRQVVDHVPLDRLVVEITEHAVVDDYETLLERIAPLRDQGLRIAVDDAGAGFSSLRHVLRLNPDVIKLDVTLIRDIDSDGMLRALSYSLSAFASAIDAAVVAEGVETAAELAALRFLGISSAQGFHLGKPVPMASFNAPVSRSRPA